MTNPREIAAHQLEIVTGGDAAPRTPYEVCASIVSEAAEKAYAFDPRTKADWVTKQLPLACGIPGNPAR
jgi:hypothetical protein